VRGRVIDTQGVPQDRVRVSLGSDPEPATGVMRTRGYLYTKTGEDGSFRLGPIRPGEHRVGLSYALLREPERVTVPIGLRELFVEITAESGETWPSIRGHVVDDTGHPVVGARIWSTPRNHSIRSSGSDGSFVVLKREGSSGTVKLAAAKLGFADHKSAVEYAWGSKDVRLVMNSVAGIELRVSDGVRPIERYAVWIANPSGFRQRWRLSSRPRSYDGFHEDGVVLVDDLRAGNYLIKVIPVDPKWLESEFHVVRVEPGPRRRIPVRLGRPSHRGVMVRHADGSPIPGAKIEVLEVPNGVDVAARTPLFRRGDKHQADHPYLRGVEVTDALGHAELYGPPDVDLTLRVSGEAFPTKIVPRVRLIPGADRVVIEVELAATLLGRIVPLRFREQLLALKPKTTTRRPGVFLRRRLSTGGFETVPKDISRPAPIRTDGRFEIGGVPPGDWELGVYYYKSVRAGDLTGSLLSIGTVKALRGGERRRQDFDVSHLLFATIELKVFVDGKPYDRKSIYLRSDHTGINVFTDASGRLRCVLSAGRYQPRVYLDGISTPVDSVVDVPPGQDVFRTIYLSTRRVQFHVVGSDGKRRGGLQLWIGYPQGGRYSVAVDPKRDPVIRCARRHVTVWAKPRGVQGGWKQHIEVARFDVNRGIGPQVIRIELPDSLGY